MFFTLEVQAFSPKTIFALERLGIKTCKVLVKTAKSAK